MTYYTERALSSRAKCKCCGSQIKRGDLKLVQETAGYNYPIKKGYCKKCGKEILKNEIMKLNEMEKELE